MRRPGKALVRPLLFVFAAGLLAIIAAVVLAFSGSPLVEGGPELTPARIDRARALIRRHDPRGTPEGRLRTVQLNGADVDALASFVASRFNSAVQILLQDREALVRATVPVPRSPIGGYLNVNLVVGETARLPRVESMTVGRLPIPDWIANRALRYAIARFSASDGSTAADVLSSVSIGEGLLRVEYEWRADLPGRLRTMAMAKQDTERLRAYQERVVRVADDLPPRKASLVDLIRPVMQLAGERAAAAAGDAAAENRAAIIVLAFYVNGKGSSALAADARDWPRARLLTVLLRRRDDLPKHFLVSAALAATAGTPLADMVGLYEEIDDSRGGSGFSFSDIAADRAGTTFGEMATGSAARARLLQSRIGEGLTEADMMPEITGLADNMPEEEFSRRFVAVGHPAYVGAVEDIERRVAGCRLFR